MENEKEIDLSAIEDINTASITSKAFIEEFQKAECEYISGHSSINSAMQHCILYFIAKAWYVCGSSSTSPDGGHPYIAEKCDQKVGWAISYTRDTLRSVQVYMSFAYFKAVGKNYTLIKKDYASPFELIPNEGFVTPSINNYSVF
jgi:hypothetical protein